MISRYLQGLASRVTGVPSPGMRQGLATVKNLARDGPGDGGAAQGPEFVALVLMSIMYVKLYTYRRLISGSSDLVTSAVILSGMALTARGQILLCSSLRNNHHRLKASGGPKAQGLFVPPSSGVFQLLFLAQGSHR